jgi:uncharacterized repeat protein (TIGR04138 family)
MQPNGFEEAVEAICEKDRSYDPEAYAFLRDALNFTIKLQKKDKRAGSRHVSGQELVEGIRQYALREFGPMVVTVFSYWGVAKTDDFGQMVFNLIEAGVFGKTDTDSREDFKNGYSFHDAFVLPFQPEKADAPDAPAAETQAAARLS